MTLDIDLSRVRSLTVRGTAGGAISDFGKYRLIRVLDLGECSNMNDSHLKKNMQVVESEIPKSRTQYYKASKANCTAATFGDTSCVSKMVVNVLPVKVIGLPCLTNLIGKFKLPDQNRALSELERLSNTEELEELCRNSKLETLSGFVTHESRRKGFLQLMVHMKNLKKVKIWSH